ncbi:uncharacterized protein LOC126687258 [Mercurialis annua]|uniref:uncharacterized protein LOC126687258 n=1 Tax=Mercurialis annua TaxID=3986 RepID=UPI00215F1A03|nr:uncharacterized protein LOC126687258 [Mercurialis annua]
MGVIKDGEVSGIIPNKEAFAVHYPGYPSSMSRAIQTLGGADAILKARSSQSNKLELYFRPEDPYSHPASGELRACNNLLLKLSKKKNKDESESQVHHVEELSADIVAHIHEAYHFDGMVDYQHVVAVHADAAAQKKKRNWTEMEEEPRFGKAGFMGMDQEDVMILVPPLFTMKDMPANLALKPTSNPSLKNKSEEAMENHFEMNLEPALAIDFTIKEIPKEMDWKLYIAQGTEFWGWQMTVSELFEERPIWPKDALIERLLVKNLKFNHQTLRRLLLAVAYYFSGGPFLRFWIRKGYDPRKDPDSRIYQRMDFRVPPPLRGFLDADAASGLKHKWEDLCKFQVIPYKFQTSLQLCELDDDYIQQEIKKPPKQTTCTYGTGWFSHHVHDSLRLRVMVRFLSVYPKLGAAKLLKAASEDFEKSKRACFYEEALKLGKEELHKVNKEAIGDEANVNQNLVDEEADEIEVDDPEEELDAYEELDLAGEKDEPSLQPYAYAENNSKSYLQQLFDTFPSAADTGSGKIQNGESSDEEYQIFEQDDDEDYLDEDDYDL